MLQKRDPALQCVVPMVNDQRRAEFQAILAKYPVPGLRCVTAQDLHGADGEATETVGPEAARWRLHRLSDGGRDVTSGGVAREQAHAQKVAGAPDMATPLARDPGAD